MSERITPGPVNGNACIREAVCVHTTKVYDSCKSKECIRDLRVYLTCDSQEFIDHGAVTVKPRNAELLCVCIDVEKVQFNRGFYTVDVRFFYRVTVEAACPVGRPQIIDGLAIADKRVVLFGSEGGARIFSSSFVSGRPDVQLQQRSNNPKAVVEVVDPIILDAKIVEPHCKCGCGCGCEVNEVPPCICQLFDTDIVLGDDMRRLYVTIGQFSIIRLERDIQLLMPAYDICLPERDCSCGNDSDPQDPCDVFDKFQFPIDEFFPPKREPSCDCGCGSICGCGSGCGNGCGSGCGGSCVPELPCCEPEPPRCEPEPRGYRRKGC